MKRLAVRQVNRFFQNVRVPSGALLELTARCNLECRHCARDLGESGYNLNAGRFRTATAREAAGPPIPHMEGPRPRGPLGAYHPGTGQNLNADLPVEIWFRVLDELAAIRTLAVAFSGGEPLLYNDLAALIRRARENRLAVSVKTNGTLLAERLPELVEAGLGILEVSLLGPCAELHDRIAGREGAFDAMTAGVSAARSAGIPLVLSATLRRETADEPEAWIKLAERLDAKLRWDYMPIEADRGTHGGHALPSPARIRAIEAIRPVHSCGIRPSRPGAACLAGVNRLAITARGEILPCVAIRRPIGRIEEGLPAAWRRLQAEGVDIMMHSSGPERCSDCALAERCLPCPGESLAATGSLAEPALERCYVTMANHGDGRRKAEGGGRERGVERDTHHAPHFTHNAQRTTRNVSS